MRKPNCTTAAARGRALSNPESSYNVRITFSALAFFNLAFFNLGASMISRRRFLEVGGVAAGMAAARPLVAVSAPVVDDASLPPSLAQLKSRKSDATPITRDERRERQQRARHLMTENALDAIVLMEGTSLRYFTGIRWWGGERTFALVLPAKSAAFYVCPGFEEGRAHEQISNAPDGEHPDVRLWQEDESPYQLIAQGLKERGIASGKIGIEETIRFVFADGHGERDSCHRRLSHDQERTRNCIDAIGGAGHTGGV
jgi:Xaa-Pro dipeptidase